MMTQKFFEIRDRGTFIPALAFTLTGSDSRLAWRAGFGPDTLYVVLVHLTSMRCNYDCYEWNGDRTMRTAHGYISEHWDTLASGAVVDVEFILSESKTPKTTEVGVGTS